MMEQDYMEITGDVIQMCGMLFEGAISLYEVRAFLSTWDTRSRTALNDVGGALYTLRQRIRKLQSSHL